jgi:hypothetical protein
MAFAIEAGLLETRNVVLDTLLLYRSDFFSHRPNATQAFNSNLVPRGSRPSLSATSSAVKLPLSSASNSLTRFAVSKVCDPQ